MIVLLILLPGILLAGDFLFFYYNRKSVAAPYEASHMRIIFSISVCLQKRAPNLFLDKSQNPVQHAC